MPPLPCNALIDNLVIPINWSSFVLLAIVSPTECMEAAQSLANMLRLLARCTLASQNDRLRGLWDSKAPRLDFYFTRWRGRWKIVFRYDRLFQFMRWRTSSMLFGMMYAFKLIFLFLLWIVTEARPSERELGSLQSLVLRNCHRLGPFQTSCYCRAELNWSNYILL